MGNEGWRGPFRISGFRKSVFLLVLGLDSYTLEMPANTKTGNTLSQSRRHTKSLLRVGRFHRALLRYEREHANHALGKYIL